MAGGNGTRQARDWYPTPPEATIALLGSPWTPSHDEPVWEPAAGDGAMVAPLIAAGFAVTATDIEPMGENIGRQNFLHTRTLRAPQIITNPPFNLAEQFIRQAMGLKADYLALLLKATYWHAAGRMPLWREYRPSAILPLTWRLDFMGLGQPTMDCSWVVWTARPSRGPVEVEYFPLEKPGNARTLGLFEKEPT